MATATGKTRCVVCGKEKATLKCGGCSKDFCYNHWDTHRQELNKQLDEIEMNRDLFRQSITQHVEQPNNNKLIQQINQWEQTSMKIIQQTAEQARQILIKYTKRYIHEIEIKLNKVTNQLRESRDEDDINEINLCQFQEELNRLTEALNKPSTVSIREDSTPFINKISVEISDKDSTFIPDESNFEPNIHLNTKWVQNGYTTAGGNKEGKELNQLSYPIGVYINVDQSIYVTDHWNDRIVEWKCDATNGQVVAGGNGKGNQMNQLNHPIDMTVDKETNHLIICDRDNRRIMRWPCQNGTTGQQIISNIDCWGLIMDNNGYLYISDYKKHEVRRWKVGETNGKLVAGGNGRGESLNQLNWPTFIFVDEDHSVYISDHGNHRVMKWMEGSTEGIVVAGGQGKGNSLTQLSGPQGLIVDHLGAVYVADSHNHRVMRWCKGATQGNLVVGDGNGKGEKANQLNYPYGLLFDRQGNFYVVDYGNHRVQRFNIDRS